jgi:uncharacterized protein (TIGR02147 family)
MAAEPDVFAHDDFRGYLRAYYAHRKAQGRGFSLRVFSRKAGLTSSNYLKLVMDGDRNLSADMANRFADACGLEGQAADYFCELVAMGQAKSHAERERVYKRLKNYRRFRKVHPLDGVFEAYYAHWYIPAIRELAGRRDFRAEPKWIANTLMPSIGVRQAAHGLKVLRELGLLVEDERGELRQAHALVKTPDKPLGHHVARYHRVMMERAAEALDLVPRAQREIASLTLCLSQAQLLELKQELTQFRDDLLHRYASGEDARRVVQLNLQLFPLTVEEE